MTVVAVATASTAAVSLSLPVEAALSTPTFTFYAPHTIPSDRMAARLHGEFSSSTLVTQCSASPVEDLPRRRILSELFQTPTMSTDELLKVDSSKLRQSKIYALRGDSRRHSSSRRFGSASGQFGGLGIGPTSLSVSRSADNVLGFRMEDFEPYNPNNSGDDDELRFSFEDFENYLDDESSLEKGTRRPVVRPLNPRLASSTSKRIAASLLKNGSTTKMGRELAISGSSRSIRPASKPKSKSHLIGEEEDLPPWFPWVPTETQINSLRVVELRAACAERDLIMTGKKAELQQRLLIWATVEDRKRVKRRLSGLKDLIRLSKNQETSAAAATAVVESYDVDALTNKRKALTKEKKRSRGNNKSRGILGLVDESYFSNSTATDEADDEEEDEEDETAYGNSVVSKASINQLSKTFNSPSSSFSNRDVRKMYIQAKAADQAGDRRRSKAILSQLREATPHDMRVVRRLARMEQEDGNITTSRTVLQQALRSDPDNAHLLHGLGQLERTVGNDYTAKKYYRRATRRNPSFPNPYHALGTLEHTHGNIRAALSVIKEGIKNCPKNHRLFHALGDVYLDANMLDLAEESYLAGLQHGTEWSKSFFYTSLSLVSYARGHTRDCRTLLRQSLEVGGGMHAQGVIALAQLEESEGNIQEARRVYRDAISSYEQKRRSRSPFRAKPMEKDHVFDTSSLVDGRGDQYVRSYAGDKWINVFKSWARMEGVHGTYETTHIVFSKAARLFPGNVSLLIQWAELQADHSEPEKARMLYEAACHRVGSKSAEPYRLFAEFEMKRKNFVEAQSILLRGYQVIVGEPTDKAPGSGCSDSEGRIGSARLCHTWGVCEYQLGSYSRAEELFDDALRVTGPEEEDSAMRSLILYSMARLEYSRKEYLLAQHCIGLSLKENLLPGGNSLIWKLWSEIAEKMENGYLVTRCKEQALLRWEEERGGAVSDLSRLLGERDDKSSDRRLPERTGSAMKDMFRKTPWYSKLCPPTGRMDKNWYRGAKLWDL